jgi:hypothetical protein
MGEKGMETGSVGMGSASQAASSGALDQMATGVGSAGGEMAGGPAQMSGETLGGGGGGIGQMMQGISSSSDDERKKP